jgi:hypothetical protein
MTSGPDTGWDEDRLLALEPQEHDFQEFKSTPYMWDAGSGRVRGDFLDNLSKQLSAFANAGGGHILIGIEDDGAIDGGVPTAIRPNGTREWLEDVIPGLLDPQLKVFNVFEITGSGPQSQIRPDHAVYAIELPTSEDAPHQARDRRYYLRIAGKSRPMSHRHILDIMHRAQHPEVLVDRVDPYGQPELVRSDPRGPKALLRLRATMHNRGKSLAQHVGCEFVLPRFAVDSECRRRTLVHEETRLFQAPGAFTFFFYHPIPIFPTQSIPFGEVWICIHQNNLQHYRDGNVVLSWRVFADAAPKQLGRVDVRAYSAVQRGIKMVEEALQGVSG